MDTRISETGHGFDVFRKNAQLPSVVALQEFSSLLGELRVSRTIRSHFNYLP
jgi:hypothetical protein